MTYCTWPQQHPYSHAGTIDPIVVLFGFSVAVIKDTDRSNLRKKGELWLTAPEEERPLWGEGMAAGKCGSSRMLASLNISNTQEAEHEGEVESVHKASRPTLCDPLPPAGLHLHPPSATHFLQLGATSLRF